MEEWKEYKLEEAISFKNGKKRNNTEGCFPIYGGNGILGYSNETNYENCVIIGRVGAYCGSVFYEKSSCWVSDNAISAMPKEGFDTQFCYYLLSQLQLNKRCIGTGQPLLTQEILNRITVNLPPLPTQQKIAQILSSLDDKIELNNKINANLEQQAQALFKSWFVDFEPFGGEMPAGWKVGKLSDLINIKYGKDHKKLEDGNIPVYGSGGIMRYVEKSLYDNESVLIPRKGTLSNVFYIDEPFWSVDTMFYSEMKKKNIAKFVYFFVKSKDLEAMNAGSAVPSMTTEILNALELVIPSKEYLEKFETVVSPMFRQIKYCEIENKKLSNLRDTLLPKLMNGEIEV